MCDPLCSGTVVLVAIVFGIAILVLVCLDLFLFASLARDL